MDTTAFEIAKSRAIALCRAAAEEPIPVEEALVHLREAFVDAATHEEIEELQALELVFEAVRNLRQIGAALSGPAAARPLTIPQPTAGSVVVPVPPNVR